MNLGYNGCTQGAHIVRKIKRTENINVPWLFFLNIDSSYADLHSRYQAIFDQGKELGIYVYCLYTDGDPEKLLPLIEHNPDCAMILLCNSAAVTEDFAKAAESLNNMLIGVAYDDNTDTACLVDIFSDGCAATGIGKDCDKRAMHFFSEAGIGTGQDLIAFSICIHPIDGIQKTVIS